MARGIRVELSANEILVYKGLEIDREILDAVIDTNKRLLWAFVRGDGGDVRAVPYSEEQVIWMADSDVVRERDVEV
jgi:hypothetical protein